MRHFCLAAALSASLLWTSAQAEDQRPTLPPGAVSHLLIANEAPSSLARYYGVSEDRLRRANPGADWSEGETIVIPAPERRWPTHTVRSGETLWRIGKGYGIGVEQLRQANGLSDNTLLPGNVLLLPRGEKPAWTAPEPAPVAAGTAASSSVAPSRAESYGSAAPRRPAPALTGAWVEVRLPDNRRAWAPVGELVVGSWQPQPADRVIEVGREFMGVPYKWGGVDPNGWDCSGFVQEVFRLGGHQVPRLADAQYEACSRVQAKELQPGDLVFFNTDGTGVSHVGIYTADRRFLHASSSRGVVEDSLDDAYFATRYLGAGRLPAWSGGELPEAGQGGVSVEE